jgi:hypothetical protein
VYIYNDRAWLPYKGTIAAAEYVGYVGSVSTMSTLVHVLRSATEADIETKLHRVHAMRDLYTYKGVLQQIDLFFQDPLNIAGKGGFLRCERVPLLHTWSHWWNQVKKDYLRPYGVPI